MWKPIKNIDFLPTGTEVVVCIENLYCEYIRKADPAHDPDPKSWFYLYTNRQVSPHKLKAYTHYFIPRPYKKPDINNETKKGFLHREKDF